MSNISSYRYQLDRSSKKVKCNACGQKTAVLYVDAETKDYLPEEVQRCDRENNCGHHVTPKEYFLKHPFEKSAENEQNSSIAAEIKPVEYISISFVERSMKGFKTSNFAIYLQMLFGEMISQQLLLKYLVGRSSLDSGKACVFWQIDHLQNVRYGKIMSYDPITGKRRKDMPPIKVPVTPANYLQTFFGCHLLCEFPNKPVAIVESEKTAIIASFYMPQFNWLATGGSSGCKWREYQVYKILEGKTIILFPDFGFYNRPSSKAREEWKTCYQEWSDRASHIQEKIECTISVSNLLEKNLSEEYRKDGPDLVDFLVRQDATAKIAVNEEGYPVIWDYKTDINFKKNVA